MKENTAKPRAPYGAYLMLVLVMVLWAGNAIIGRAVRFDIPPLTFAFGRWLIATLLILPFALGPIRRDWLAVRSNWPVLLVFGVLGIALFNSLLYTGLHHSTAANALLIQAGVPGFVMALNRILFGDRAKPLQAFAVVLAMAGVAVIVFEGSWTKAMQLAFSPGDIIILATAIVWALYTVLLRKRPPVSPITFTALTFAIGAATLAPLALLEWEEGLRIHWSLRVVGAYGYVAVLASLAAYFLFNVAAVRTGPVIAGQAITLLPLFGAITSTFILGEPLHLHHALGMALIFGGIVMGAVMEWHKTSAGAAASARLEDAP